MYTHSIPFIFLNYFRTKVQEEERQKAEVKERQDQERADVLLEPDDIESDTDDENEVRLIFML